MSCSTLVIDSLTNNNSGVAATVVLSGTPNGSVSFWYSHTPDMAKPILAASQLESLPNVYPATYSIIFTHPALWYVWAKDNNGYSAPAAIWVDFSADVSDVDLTGMQIRNILDANKLGIEYILHLIYPDASLQQVVYGYEGAIIDYPSILISSPRVQERYVGFPFVREATYSFTIQCLLEHSTEGTELPVMGQFTRAIQMILNQPAYETFLLSNGVTMQFNFCSDTSVDEYEQNGKFITIGSMVWTGNTIYQDTGSY